MLTFCWLLWLLWELGERIEGGLEEDGEYGENHTLI